MWAELKEGLAYVLRTSVPASAGDVHEHVQLLRLDELRDLLVYAARVWHMSAAVVGLGLGLGSVGWLLGAVFVGRLQARLGVGTTTLVACVLFGVPAADSVRPRTASRCPSSSRRS
jgi:hypothetical protein